MKLMQITFHFEFTERVEEILDRNGVAHYVRYPMVAGKDCDGKHLGNQIYPGNVTVLQAQVAEDTIDNVWRELGEFKASKPAHQHLEALLLPIEKRLQ